jgi:exosortase family protein XrtM
MARSVTKASTPLRFGIVFVIGFAVLMSAFEASRGSAFERFLVEDLVLAPTVYLIDAVTPNEHAELIGRTISSPASNLRITRGCEGIEMFILLIAAILAFPASVKRRLQGLFFGALLAYALSVLRLMALHYVLRHSPSAWEALHGLILPLGPIILLALFFMRWSAETMRVSLADSEVRAT